MMAGVPGEPRWFWFTAPKAGNYLIHTRGVRPVWLGLYGPASTPTLVEEGAAPMASPLTKGRYHVRTAVEEAGKYAVKVEAIR
jgi:hypothetical protein